MVRIPASGEIRIDRSERWVDDFIRELLLWPEPSEGLESEQEIDPAVGDFITRQVLEKDSVLFEG